MSSRKRQRAIISQDDRALALQADDAEMDLVGLENELIGGDRSTAGVRIKGSTMPKNPGVFKGGFKVKDRVISRLADSLAPAVDFTLVENDIDAKTTAGGFQLVWDNAVTLTRNTTTGLDSFTAVQKLGMETTQKQIFQKAYRKIGNDVNAYSVIAVESTNVNETHMPSLYVSNYINTKTFNNLGTNTIVIELWDMLCTEDTSLSPCQAWAKDLYEGGYGSTTPGTAVLDPVTVAAMRKSWGDPGVRPMAKRDKTLHDFWKTLRVTRYLVRSGQTIHHTTSLPQTELSHTKLYGYNNTGSAVETHTYLKDMSIVTMGFALGELCYDERAGSQQISTSSVFIQGRSIIEFTARTLPRTRQRYAIMTDYSFIDYATRMKHFPSIATIDQKILSQQQPGAEIDVQDMDEL